MVVVALVHFSKLYFLRNSQIFQLIQQQPAFEWKKTGNDTCRLLQDLSMHKPRLWAGSWVTAVLLHESLGPLSALNGQNIIWVG